MCLILTATLLFLQRISLFYDAFNIINFFDQFLKPTMKGTIFRMTLSRPDTFPTNHYQADHHEIQKSIIMCLINLFTVNLGHSAC